MGEGRGSRGERWEGGGEIERGRREEEMDREGEGERERERMRRKGRKGRMQAGREVKASASRAEDSRVRIPLATGFFRGRVIPVT